MHVPFESAPGPVPTRGSESSNGNCNCAHRSLTPKPVHDRFGRLYMILCVPKHIDIRPFVKLRWILVKLSGRHAVPVDLLTTL